MSKTKKILHLGKFYPPAYGGIESVTQILAEGASSVYQVTVVCFTREHKKILKEQKGKVQIIRCPSFVTISSQPLSFSYFWYSVKQSLQADIIHLHAPNVLATFAAFFMPRAKKMLVHWHSDIVGKGFLGILARLLERCLLKRADTIIATSRNYADGSASLKFVLNKVKIVPIGIQDLSAVHNIDDKKINHPSVHPQLLNFVRNKKVVLSVGRLVPYKGFRYLIKSARYLDDDQVIVIVGSGEQKTELQKLIADTQLSEKVYLCGKVNFEELQALYYLADIFCMSSVNKAEAFGVVLLEAMSFSLPIVATNIQNSGVPWVNQHQKTGLNVAIEDSKALADACQSLLKNKTMQKNYSQASRQRFETCFTAKIFVNNVLALYKKLLR